jgi:cytochrome P450
MSALPPGPGIPYGVQTVRLMRQRHTFVPAMHRRYGDVFTLQVAPGPRPMVFLRRPEHIKQVFAGDPHVFHAGDGNAILGPVMGEHSVLLTDEDQHLRARRLLMPAFNGAALRRYQSLVEVIARREAEAWPASGTVSGLDRMNRLTLEIILQVVFGVTDEQRLSRLRPRVTTTVDIGPWILLGWIYPRLQRWGPWRRYGVNLVELDRLVYDEIAERRTQTDLAERDDVLSRLLLVGGHEDEEPLTDAELRDQLVTLLLAGHETTASALAWSLHELGRDRTLLDRAQQAADRGDDGYLEAVLKESMRLHPVIPMVTRVLTSPQRVAGYELPAGVTVAPSILLAHASEESYPDHESFRPERFLDDQPAPHTWIPFGGGVRRCLGAGFSLMEGVVVLREVLTRYDVQAERPERPRVRNITSVPAARAPLEVTARWGAAHSVVSSTSTPLASGLRRSATRRPISG